jgi:hypothetical protein
MTAADISADISIQKDIAPNLGAMIDVVRVTCTENDDWIEMSNYGYTTVYMAFALVSNATEAVTISDSTKIVFGAGGTDTITLLVVGV